MNRVRDSFCSFCGAAFAAPLTYPRTCPNAACGVTVWANPIPVAVGLVPIVLSGGAPTPPIADDRRTGLLVVRRAIEPRRGMLALVGGFVEETETWQGAMAREICEEAGVAVDAAAVEPFWFVSTAPAPNRVLLFGVCPPIDARALPPLPANHEASERGAVFGPRGLAEVLAFPLHARAAERWFATQGVDGPHDYHAV
jgi:ADP-ribose pyrophosphatase YjhB (NUDIX family)